MTIAPSATTVLRQSFRVGERVQLHPATDRWMRGDQYGTVCRIGPKLVSVKLDRSGQTARLHPSNVLHLGETA